MWHSFFFSFWKTPVEVGSRHFYILVFKLCGRCRVWEDWTSFSFEEFLSFSTKWVLGESQVRQDMIIPDNNVVLVHNVIKSGVSSFSSCPLISQPSHLTPRSVLCILSAGWRCFVELRTGPARPSPTLGLESQRQSTLQLHLHRCPTGSNLQYLVFVSW